MTPTIMGIHRDRNNRRGLVSSSGIVTCTKPTAPNHRDEDAVDETPVMVQWPRASRSSAAITNPQLSPALWKELQAMLKGIPRVMSPELMDVLMRMGHGDDLVIADGNFPAETMG
jgi:RbsD / FucU transport protein family